MGTGTEGKALGTRLSQNMGLEPLRVFSHLIGVENISNHAHKKQLGTSYRSSLKISDNQPVHFIWHSDPEGQNRNSFLAEPGIDICYFRFLSARTHFERAFSSLDDSWLNK